MNNTNKNSRPYKSATTDTLKARRQELLDMMPDPDHVIRASLITDPSNAASLTADVPMAKATRACTFLLITMEIPSWILSRKLIKTKFPSVSKIMRTPQDCLQNSAALTWNCSGAERSTFSLKGRCCNRSNSHTSD